jgi:hypothetical protein
MYLLYADESGDIGLARSPTTHFALSGLVLHESRWRDFITQMVAFRRWLRANYGLPIRTEIHASEYIRHPPFPGLSRPTRLKILQDFIDELAQIDYISITNVVVDKTDKPSDYDVFTKAWQAMFQRFENTLQHGNFPGGFRREYGVVLTDNTDGRKLTRMVRRMAVHNPIPHMSSLYGLGSGYRNMPILRVIEDPSLRDSRASYPIQACDTVAYFLMQRFRPNKFVKKAGAQLLFERLDPVLNKHASTRNRLGIVHL